MIKKLLTISLFLLTITMQTSMPISYAADQTESDTVIQLREEHAKIIKDLEDKIEFEYQMALSEANAKGETFDARAFYEEKNKETQALYEQFAAEEAAINKSFAPSLIPRPETLPGPIETELATGGFRKTFSEITLPRIAVTLIGFAGTIALIMLIYGGIIMATSFGIDQNLTKGKDIVRYSIIGLIICILAYTIVRIIINLNF